MEIEHHKSLKEYNTFGIDVSAETFISIQDEVDLNAILKKNYARELFILGGGSNMLLTKDITATVLHIDLKGILIEELTEESVTVKVSAGENWHQFVLWTLQQDFGGLENLSLIPGNVGTSPIQNIGAYGVELKDTFVSCEAIHIQTLEKKTFTNADCQFGYRNSIFKLQEKGNYIITSVIFQLSKNKHTLHTGYGIIEEELRKHHVINPTIQDVSKAVIAIRSSKLPDPRVLGNSGSFFKNPVIAIEEYERLKLVHENLPHYPVSEKFVKVPAGWLIDQSGLKGYRDNDAGVHKKQALVLVNYGKATGLDILNLSDHVKKVVKDKFEIQLEAEVNII